MKSFICEPDLFDEQSEQDRNGLRAAYIDGKLHKIKKQY